MPALSKAQVEDFLSSDGFGISSFSRFICDEDAAFDFSRHTKILNIDDPQLCDLCSREMVLSLAPGNQCRYMWTCARPCRKRVNISAFTIFDRVRIPYSKVLEIILHWLFEVPVTSACGQIGISKETGIYWYKLCRSVCDQIELKDTICIGGAGLHVEIDESHICTNKYHRGRPLASQQRWIFGAICRESREGFIMEVPNRKGITLWPEIRARIHPESIILHDDARVYKNLHLPGRGGFSHGIVNHSKKIFVNPANRSINTNTIERRWGVVKGKVKKFMGDQNLDMHIGEFMYREKNFKIRTDRERRHRGPHLNKFLEDLRNIFPGFRFNFDKD